MRYSCSNCSNWDIVKEVDIKLCIFTLLCSLHAVRPSIFKWLDHECVDLHVCLYLIPHTEVEIAEIWDRISHDMDAFILLVLTFILDMLNRNSSPVIPRQYNHQLYYFISQKNTFTPALLFPPLLNLQLFVVNLAFRHFKRQEHPCMNCSYYGSKAVTLKPSLTSMSSHTKL